MARAATRFDSSDYRVVGLEKHALVGAITEGAQCDLGLSHPNAVIDWACIHAKEEEAAARPEM